jgi:mevalonate kinase
VITLVVIDIVELEHTITYNNKAVNKNVTENAMATVKLNVEYDLLLQKTKLSSNIKERENNNTIAQPADHIYFVICNSCYWCASYFSIDDMEFSSQVLSCHVCNSHNTELIPISSNESFRIKYNITRGMEMEFCRSNDIVDRQPTINEQHQVPIYF